MKNTFILFIFLFGIQTVIKSQENFAETPLEAKFITEDFERFWQAFDKIEKIKGNPFDYYLKNASEGLSPLVGYFDSKVLYKTVKERKKDYLKSRNVLDSLYKKENEIKDAYKQMKKWYPIAKFPPVYFAVGMFTTGGTVTDKGLLIGSEMLKNLDGLTGLVSHELIHYQQNISGKDNLLKQSIIEGSADFIGELISGKHINLVPFNYGNKNEEALCKEFVKVMDSKDYNDWLYGTSGKDNRPNDLGYWIGYKITKSYFEKTPDKKQAIKDILNIKEPTEFLKESGYLEKYIKQ
ncbi:DUF2268 domain-containing putative Zn-dependent protease [Polaribacter porphyrae]|uniref:DUF2268 domain-containing protein n=1 Tax=Polaribacter porphyrae TaxID=1137780 RepID=A0A2S7WNP3_9FLAO|nr:DUF2268 domain-containing putative Zn-dependent protease [Polaribacter porphyrae]PQJ78932.1 hypothetical protein BTO18_06950 [Polaribacter porphyrae]